LHELKRFQGATIKCHYLGLLRPSFVAIVTEFRKYTQNSNIVAYIATNATQNYSHWAYFIW